MKRFEKQGDRWEEISLIKNEVRAGMREMC